MFPARSIHVLKILGSYLTAFFFSKILTENLLRATHCSRRHHRYKSAHDREDPCPLRSDILVIKIANKEFFSK